MGQVVPEAQIEQFLETKMAEMQIPGMSLAIINEGKLGLPGKEYYVKDDDETLRLQGEYKTFVSQVLQLTGTAEDIAGQEAERIFQLEKLP